MPSLPFDIAAASVLGREHARAGRNNQDAFHVESSAQGLAALVCDGCGSEPASEVGAQLGARRIARAALALLASGVPVESPEFLTALRDEALGLLRQLARDLGGASVKECLLFTVVGAVVTPPWTLVFSAGDGVWGLNGEVHRLGPFPGNAPPYLAYGLFPEQAQALVRHACVPTDEVMTLMLGTDGVGDLGGLATARVPGTAEPVGPLSRLWSEEHYFQNPDALRRRLTLLTREAVRVEAGRLARSPGLLPDDTTLVILRRRMGRA